MSDDLLTYDWSTSASLREQLILHEGDRSRPYADTVGRLTIGIGRNLSDVGISTDERDLMFANDVRRAQTELDAHIPWWRELDVVRQRVMIDMCFNLGWGDGVRGLSSFKRTLVAIHAGQFEDAADGLRMSRWARQVGERATRLISMIRTGSCS